MDLVVWILSIVWFRFYNAATGSAAIVRQGRI
jgi:hypothetical protein